MHFRRLFHRKHDYSLEVAGLGTLTRHGHEVQPRYIWRGTCNFLWWKGAEVDLNYEAGADLEPMAESLSRCLSGDAERLRRDIQTRMDQEFPGVDLWTTQSGEPVTLYLGAYSELNVTYYTKHHSVTILLQGDHVADFICRKMTA